MAYRLFEGMEHAASYLKNRISLSHELIQKMINFMEKRKGRPFDLAVDVGCGSGQATVMLAKHFASVVGADVSAAQLEFALQNTKEPNVTYRECAAEDLPFADSSVDLVTAVAAFHWFDRPRFLQETDRVLKPRGCLALLSYTMDVEISYQDCSSDTLNQVCQEFYEAIRPYRHSCLWPSPVDLYRATYESLSYPDKEWQEIEWVKESMPLCRYIGMVESFSCYQALLRENPQKAASLSKGICQKLMSIMKVTSPDTEVVVAVRCFYILACKPEKA